MGAIILAGMAATIALFRKGGPYNPEIAPIPEQTVDSPSVPFNHVVPPESSEKRPTLTQVCNAMALFEGGPGEASYRNNNPLNCKFFTGGYLPMYEPVKKSAAGFAIFPSREIGWLYGFNMLKNKIKNHPNWTLRDLVSDHAPASDNNPVDIYTAFVAKGLGVDNLYPVSKITLS